MKNISHEPESALTPADQRRQDIQHHIAALEDLADPATRIDGWTPFARRLFLDALADHGKVEVACSFTGMTRQSAYALRARDPLFAAGWDAACELARMPLADALYERALEGYEEVITRDDGRTVTRHRFDSRLSIAVLNRLDRHAERASEKGSRHLGALQRWDDFIAAIGRGEHARAEAMLENAAPPQTAIHCQNCQLPYSDEEEKGFSHPRVWRDWKTEEWRTDYPPSPDFTGVEEGDWQDEGYRRSLDEAEMAALIAAGIAEPVNDPIYIDDDAVERDTFFNGLASAAPPLVD
jgi:hypothetical protein